MITDNLCSQYKETVYPITDFADNITKYVYLLHNPLSNLSKIGITNNPRLRKMQLQNASGMELNTLLVIELEEGYDETPRTIEVFLHSFYKHSNFILGSNRRCFN